METMSTIQSAVQLFLWAAELVGNPAVAKSWSHCKTTCRGASCADKLEKLQETGANGSQK